MSENYQEIAHNKRKRLYQSILWVVFYIIIYRFLIFVPIPGMNAEKAVQITALYYSNEWFSVFFGDALKYLSVFSLGISPLISSQLVISLLIPIVPSWTARIENDPKEGAKWKAKNSLRLTFLFTILQSMGLLGISWESNCFHELTIFFEVYGSLLTYLTAIMSLTAGTFFLIWICDQISELGIVNGPSLIFLINILANLSSLTRNQFREGLIWQIAFQILLVFVFVVLSVYILGGRRNVPVMYPDRRIGNRMSMPVKGTLPLYPSMAGTVPIIFASSLIVVLNQFSNYFQKCTPRNGANLASFLNSATDPSRFNYQIGFSILIFSFTIFYTDVIFSQEQYGENLKQAGAQIPGVSRGWPTQHYLNRVLRRVVIPFAFFLSLISVLPFIINQLFNGSLVFTGFVQLYIAVSILRQIIQTVYFRVDRIKEEEKKAHVEHLALLAATLQSTIAEQLNQRDQSQGPQESDFSSPELKDYDLTDDSHEDF